MNDLETASPEESSSAQAPSWALLLDGKGSAVELDNFSGWRLPIGQLWIHVDANHPEWARRLRERSELSPAVLDELVRADAQPRMEELEDGAILAVLRGLAPDLDRTRGHRTELHIWADPTRIISVCDRPLPGLVSTRKLLEQGRGPQSLPALMVAMAAGLATSLRETAAELEAAVADLEYTTEAGSSDTSVALIDLRRRVATSRRILAPFKVLCERMLALEHSWLLRDSLKDWKRLADTLRDTDALLQSLHERLVSAHDFVGERSSRRMNAVLYRLTIFSTILLPITAITGVLGMNVSVPGASYPLMSGSFTFFLVIVFLCILGWIEYRFMRKRHLLLPSLDELPQRGAGPGAPRS